MEKWSANYQEVRGNSSTDKTGRRLLIALDVEESFETHRVRTLPDGFDANESTLRAMRGIASSFGVSLSTIWTREMSALAGTGDAELVELDVQGKLLGWYKGRVINSFKEYVLPETLEMTGHNANDDSEQSANVELVRAGAANSRLLNRVTDVRYERLRAVEDGYLARSEFERMELAEGRLPDGNSVLSLWYDPAMAELLAVDMERPAAVELNDAVEAVRLLVELREKLRAQSFEPDGRSRGLAYQIAIALAAVEELIKRYG
jgi:hypothetical protein